MGRPYPRFARILATVLIGTIGMGVFALSTTLESVNDTIWVANRGAHTIRGFDASTGAEVRTVAMAPLSSPGDLAYAKGKLYVAEEYPPPQPPGSTPAPAIAIVDVETGAILSRLFIPAALGVAARPHHVHASQSGNLVAVGLYGTDHVAVVDTHTDTFVGVWDSNTSTTTGRVHAGVFSNDDRALYLANEGANEIVAIDPLTGFVFWRMNVPAVHELAVTHNGKWAFASRRSANKLALVNLEKQTYEDVLTLGLPDTLALSANEKLLTVGLRTSPAQVAVIDTRTLAYELVNLSPSAGSGTVAGHQWTSPGGRYTFATFERGTSQGVAVIDHSIGHQVILTLAYPGAPHGIDRALP